MIPHIRGNSSINEVKAQKWRIDFIPLSVCGQYKANQNVYCSVASGPEGIL